MLLRAWRIFLSNFSGKRIVTPLKNSPSSFRKKKVIKDIENAATARLPIRLAVELKISVIIPTFIIPLTFSTRYS